MRHIVFIFLAVCLAFLVRQSFTQPFYWDTERFLIPAARQIKETGNILAYAKGMTDYPHTFLLPLLISFLFYLPNPVVAIHLLSFIFSFVFLIVIYFFGRFLGHKKTGLILSLLMVTNPLFLAQTALVYFEIPSAVFRYLALVFLFKKKYRFFLIASITAFLIRFENGFILFLVGLVYMTFEVDKRKLFWFSKFLLPLILINGFWFGLHFLITGWWFYSPMRHFEENFLQTGIDLLNYLFIWQGRKLVFYLAGGLVFVLIFKKTFWLGFKNTLTYTIVLMVMSLATTLIVFKLGYFLPRYVFPLLPVFYLAAISIIDKALGRNKALFILIVLVLLVNQLRYIRVSFSGNLEDSLLVVQYIDLKKRVASYLEKHPYLQPLVVEFPEDGELTNPDFGYVSKPVKAINVDNFNPSDYSQFMVYKSPLETVTSDNIQNLIEDNRGFLVKEFQSSGLKIRIYRIKKKIE